MKKFLQTLITCGLLGAAAFARADGPPINLITVDIEKIYSTHYELIAEQAKLKADGQKAQDEYDQMRKEANDLYTQFNTAKDESTNATASPDAQAKAKADAQQLYNQVNQKLQEINQFRQQAQEQIQQRINQFRTMLMDQITQTVKEVAKRHNATLVIDKSGPSAAGIPVVIYSDPGYDITQEVVDEIAKNRPPNTETTAPSAMGPGETAPAPSSSSSAPSSAPSSGFTIPNVTPQQ